MASADDGNYTMTIDQEVVADAPLGVSDSPMDGDSSRTDVAAAESATEEISPVQNWADTATNNTESVDLTGDDDTGENAEPIKEQSVQVNTRMEEEANGTAAAAVASVEDEVSPAQDRAVAATNVEGVYLTGVDGAREKAEPAGEQAVQVDAPMDEESNGSAAVSVEAAAEEEEELPAEGPSTDHENVVDRPGGNDAREDATETAKEHGVQTEDAVGADGDVVMSNDVVDDAVHPQDVVAEVAKVADHAAEEAESTNADDATNEQGASQPNLEHGEDAHAADELVENEVEESDDDDERHHEHTDQRAGGDQHDGDHDKEDIQSDDHNHDGDDPGDVVHNEDEYDPANPTHDSDMNAYDPSHAEDEYDPANPTEGFTNGKGKKDDTVIGSPVRKRKLSDSATAASTASPAASSTSARSPKRPRNDSTPKIDQRGLKNAAWDRLMDFESTKEFRIAQVSRAAFATIAQLPDFAQCAIVARFARTPMKDIRDKNELILKLCREYLSENPQVSSLQPVSVFVADAAADPGLFAYGYAPPMPLSGMSTIKIPFRQDKPGTISTTSAPSFSPQKLPKPVAKGVVKPELDEFGREIKPKAAAPSTPSKGVQSAPAITTAAAQTAASPAPATGKPSDPRRRRQGGTEATPVEPVRTPPASNARGQIEKSDVYNRLPVSVRSRLDSLIAAQRLPEAINDNVLSRLNHLPESTAVTAIAKFMETDLGQVGNINGFLVGIINRVQERTSNPSDPRNGAAATRSAPSNAPGATYHQQQHQQQHVPHQPPQHQFSQHAPVAQHGYTNPSPAPAGYPHSFEHAPGNDFRGHPMQPPMAAASVGYDVRDTLPAQAPAYASDPQLVWHPAHAGAPAPHSTYTAPPAAAGRFSSQPTIDQAITKLPVSVQNHLVSLVNSRILPSLEDLSEKCYEVLGQLSEGLANDVLKRFGTANLSTVRNYSAFLMGVVKKCRQEYGFD